MVTVINYLGNEIMNVWRLITHHEDKDAALFWTRQNSRVAIGWGAIRDIRIRGYNSADVIVRRDLSPEDIWKKAGGAARQNVHQTLIRCE